MQSKAFGRENRGVQRKPKRAPVAGKSLKPANVSIELGNSPGPFLQGAIVLVTLNNPREKFWGAMLGLTSAGVSLHGIELSSFDNVAMSVASGEPMPSAALFFPMHRLERIELDLPDGSLPSLSQRFSSRTGMKPSQALKFAGNNRRSRA